MKRFLVIQTAFIGDAILTLPIPQVLKKNEADVRIDVVAIPRTSEIFSTHPSIDRVLLFDKKNSDRGVSGLRRIVRRLREAEYDVAIIPHRSLRSALLARWAKIPVRVGFERSAGWFMMTKVVQYDPRSHEVDRNLSLLAALGIKSEDREFPKLYPSTSDIATVDQFLLRAGVLNSDLIGIAPGSVWKTKRWIEDRYAELAKRFEREGFRIVLVGGKEDELLCEQIRLRADSAGVITAAGKMSLLQSAELIRRCRVLISNDSAPMHIALAMQTPVVAIYGSTVPEFGFAPYGKRDVVVQTDGLRCRPCSIHGGHRCPIKTFDCMMRISTNQLYETVRGLLVD